MQIITTDGNPPANPPRTPEGELYLYEMVLPDGTTRVYADTATELCNVLLGPEYAALDDEDIVTQTSMRISYAVGVAMATQAEIVNSDLGDDPDATDEEIEAVYADKMSSVRMPVWRSTIPLTLVNAFYEPVPGMPPLPRSEPRRPVPYETVWVLRVEDELSFLLSLAEFGHIGLAEAV